MTGPGVPRPTRGRIVSMREGCVGAEAYAVVTVRERATGRRLRDLRRVINCTGPDTTPTRGTCSSSTCGWSGLIRPDELGRPRLGRLGCVIDAGRNQPGLYSSAPARANSGRTPPCPNSRNGSGMATTLSGVVVRTPALGRESEAAAIRGQTPGRDALSLRSRTMKSWRCVS